MLITSNFSSVGVIADGINYAKTGVGIFEGFRLTRDQFWPLGYCKHVILTTMLAPYQAVDLL